MSNPSWPLPELRSFLILHTYSAEGATLLTAGAALVETASQAWPTANMAFYIPLRLAAPQLAQKIVTMNGATVSNNLDAGIYSVDGTRLVSSGSVAQSGTNALQSVDITDTLLGPGMYYMALAMDGTSGTFFAAGSGLTLTSILQQASAFPLPAVATFARMATGYGAIMGVAFKTLI